MKRLGKSKWLWILVALSTIVVAGLLIVQRGSDSHDFEVDGVYYKVVDDFANTVAVTYKGADCDAYEDEYSGAVEIPSSITYRGRSYKVGEIGAFAFSGCSKMTSITIPASVWSVGFAAFSGCDSLKEVHISDLSAWCELSFSDLVDDVGDSPLNYADELYLNGELVIDLVVPEDVTEIGAHAFEGYDKLRSVVLHDGISAVYKSAFLNCANLTDVHIPEEIGYVGVYAFDGTLWYENKPDGEVYIGKLLYKYKGEMPMGSSLIIKDGTVAICQSAFDGCEGLTSITLPSSLTCVHNYAFCGCLNLKDIYCESLTPPSLNRFYNDFHEDVTIYVPKGAGEAYKSNDFDNVVELDFNNDRANME